MLEARVRKQSRKNGTWRNEDVGIENTVLMVVDVVQLLSHVSLYATPWTAAHQAPMSITLSRSLLRFMFIKSVILSSHLILCHHAPFSFCLQSFPASGSFPVSRLFTPGDQRIGASVSASVIPVNLQD